MYGFECALPFDSIYKRSNSAWVIQWLSEDMYVRALLFYVIKLNCDQLRAGYGQDKYRKAEMLFHCWVDTLPCFPIDEGHFVLIYTCPYYSTKAGLRINFFGN